jgi:putative endonuclease
MAWVYILECADGSLYTGFTAHGEARLVEHHLGILCDYPRVRRPVRLVFSQETSKTHEAFVLEQQVKGWRRAKKLALIRGEFDLLPGLSRSGSLRRVIDA